MRGRSDADAAAICLNCENLFLGEPRQKYCSHRCSVKAGNKKRILAKQNNRVCEDCGQVGIEPYQHFLCKACARLRITSHSQYTSARLRQEYQELMEKSDHIKMREFIRLMTLAEMFGRDLEEWINSVPRLAELQARLMEDRRVFDEGEKRRDLTVSTLEDFDEAVSEYEIFMATHPHFPRRGPVCHINACKALEFFRKHDVKAKLVCFDPARLGEVTYYGLAPNHVWVDVEEIGYYDAHAQMFYCYDNHPYGDERLFSEPEYDKLSDIFPAHFIKAWERKKDEEIDWDEVKTMDWGNGLGEVKT